MGCVVIDVSPGRTVRDLSIGKLLMWDVLEIIRDVLQLQRMWRAKKLRCAPIRCAGWRGPARPEAAPFGSDCVAPVRRGERSAVVQTFTLDRMNEEDEHRRVIRAGHQTLMIRHLC
ncbi:hypothetical protein F2P81_019772 [Scophthalmus maximus]|uniref:Uncharacterized protein n=1 Tax=Scophthalmus maximus TaxID=52904 RepID=A0A6A4S7F9_SCOMX|nr:hypothetical protein F2P81_019772 [Scophthalmus maximus]